MNDNDYATQTLSANADVSADNFKYKPTYNLTRFIGPREPAPVAQNPMAHPLFMTGLPKDHATNTYLRAFAAISAGVIETDADASGALPHGPSSAANAHAAAAGADAGAGPGPAGVVSLREHLSDERARRLKRTARSGVAFWSIGPGSRAPAAMRGELGVRRGGRAGTVAGTSTGAGTGAGAGADGALRTRLLAQRAAAEAALTGSADGYVYDDPAAAADAAAAAQAAVASAVPGTVFQPGEMITLGARAPRGGRGGIGSSSSSCGGSRSTGLVRFQPGPHFGAGVDSAGAEAEADALWSSRYDPTTGRTRRGGVDPRLVENKGVEAMRRARVAVPLAAQRARSAAVVAKEAEIAARHRAEAAAAAAACGSSDSDEDVEEDIGAHVQCETIKASDLDTPRYGGDDDDDDGDGYGQDQLPGCGSDVGAAGAVSEHESAVAVAQVNTFLRLWNIN
jgi:hypothetical protein